MWVQYAARLMPFHSASNAVLSCLILELQLSTQALYHKTEMKKVFARAQKVMRLLCTASTASAERSGSTLAIRMLRNRSTKKPSRERHVCAYSQCCEMTYLDALGTCSSLNEAPCSCAHAAENRMGNDEYFAKLWTIKRSCMLAKLRVSSTESSCPAVSTTPASYAHATTHTLLNCTDGDVKGRSCSTEARTTAVYRLYGLCCTFCSLHA